MALAETIIGIGITLLGFGMLYLSLKRDGVMWSIIATVLFLANIGYSMSLPFSTNALGQVTGSSANIMLAGINLLFGIIALLKTVKLGMELYR